MIPRWQILITLKPNRDSSHVLSRDRTVEKSEKFNNLLTGIHRDKLIWPLNFTILNQARKSALLTKFFYSDFIRSFYFAVVGADHVSGLIS